MASYKTFDNKLEWNIHEQGSSNPVVENGSKRSLNKEGRARLEISFGKEPNCTQIKDNSAPKGECEKLNEYKRRNLQFANK